MNYKTIQVIKKSEKVEVLFATVEGLEKPVVVKRLKEVNPEIYRAISKLQTRHIPLIYQMEQLIMRQMVHLLRQKKQL